MTRTAEQTARSAELVTSNRPGYCLQWCRERADISARYPDASTAWAHTTDKHRDRQVPRGAMAYWTGGSQGYGHIAVGVGGGRVRSTDANGAGNVATRTLAWFDAAWPSIDYAGWAWNVNGVEIPHEQEDDEMSYRDWPEADKQALANDVADAVWSELMSVTKPDGTKVIKTAEKIIRETWSKLAKHMDGGP